MKKIYIEPQVCSIILKPIKLLNNSIPTETTETSGEKGWGTPQSLDVEFEEWSE